MRHDRIVAICCNRNPDTVGEVGADLWIPAEQLRAEAAITDGVIQASWSDVIEQLVKPTAKAIKEKGREQAFKDLGIDPSWKIAVPGGPVVEQFQEFVKRWEKWKEDNSKMPSSIPLGRGGIFDQVIGYRKEAVKWRDKLKQFGVAPSTPQPEFPPESGFPWKTAIITGGIVIGAIVLLPWGIRMIASRG